MIKERLAAIAGQRLRLRFRRDGVGCRLTHLQQIDAIRKALLRSSWPVSRKGQKGVKIKASFGPAISLGYASEAEYCDVELDSRLDMKTGMETLAPCLPEGYALMGIKSIPRFFPSLEESLNMAVYEVISPLLSGTEGLWADFQGKEHVFVTKKSEDREVVIDARPCVRGWRLDGEKLELELRFGPRRTLKPEKILQAVCQLKDDQVETANPASLVRIKRMRLYFEKQNGDLVEP